CVVTGLSRADGTLVEPTLVNAAPAFSEAFLHCPEDPTKYDPGNDAVAITLSVRAQTGEERAIGTQRIFTIAPAPGRSSSAVHGREYRPTPFVSVRSDLELIIEGEAAQPMPGGHNKFIVRSGIRLPVGWEAIELFPPFDPAVWNPENAAAWA